MPNRKYTVNSSYRYGFNGKENDKDISEGSLDFGARIYDGRLGRWMSVDRFAKAYSSNSPYSYSLNNPIILKDEGGNWITDKDGNPIYTTQGGTFIDNKSVNGYYYLFETRTYFTNDGKEVMATVYTGRIKAEKVSQTFQYNAADVMNIPKDEAYVYDCHGNTCFKDQNIYIPGGSKDPKVNELVKKNPGNIFRNKYEYDDVNSDDVKAGDVALFGSPKKEPRIGDPFSAVEEGINHSATSNGDGTFTTKDDRAPLNKKATIEEMEKMWGELLGYVRFKGNQDGKVESKNGLVTEETAKQAIRNVKQRIDPKGYAKDLRKEAKAADKAEKKKAKE